MSTDLEVTSAELTTSTLFGTDNPAEVVARASGVATALADLVRKQNLTVRIQSTDYVRVEGWTLLGSMLGVFPVVTWTRPVMGTGEDAEWIGWEARVEARTRSGEVVGAAEAQCLRDERSWKGRDDYALRSMAQTRAVSKALRLPLGFVMQLAGFNPTPAEEMPVIEGSTGEPSGAAAPPQASGPVGSPASPVDDPAHGTPFTYGDEPVEPPGGDTKRKPTTKQLDALTKLVKQLEGAGHLTILQVWQSVGIEPTADDYDGDRLRWTPLRDQLNRAQASQLLDRLIPYAKDKLGEAA